MQQLAHPNTVSSRLRIVLHPIIGPDEGIDVTDSVTHAIADAIARQCQGNDVLNQLEAEMLLVGFLEHNLASPAAQEPH